jgi:hypothetical protein
MAGHPNSKATELQASGKDKQEQGWSPDRGRGGAALECWNWKGYTGVKYRMTRALDIPC